MNNHNEDELPLIKVDSLKRIFKVIIHFVSYIVYGLSEIIIKTVEEYYKININESNE